MTRARTAIVIGGGIAGPVTALALHRAGIEATIYEAHPGTADGFGGRIALAPNGVSALGIVGAADAVVAAAQPIDRTVMAVGGRRIEMPGISGAGPMQMIGRADLYQILRDLAVAAGVRFLHGKRLTGVREEPQAATALFADGSEARADVLIGADGVHSTVRGLIDPAAPGPRYTGMLAFEGLSPARVDSDLRTMTFAFGRKAYYLYWPVPAGGAVWGVNLPSTAPLTIAEARSTPPEQWLSELLATYGPDTPGGDLMRATPPESLLANGALHIMPPVPHWHRGRMVLVGDSVHAPSNSSGQGASLSIESAVQLARCLRDLDVPPAFATYERLRRARVEGVAAQAAKVNHAKAPGRLGQAVLPLLMRPLMKIAMKPEKTLGPVLRYRIDWDAPAGEDRPPVRDRAESRLFTGRPRG
ncbi:FAD-dependent oxidoreductase [Actinoplanes sp. NPDC051343]|uniref:FAD-dependent oxidoreductase n=1 Tax=Actinoplanes sp. NPDC051343 TaxID=3363906 RepID=UPI0037BCBCA1